MRNFEFRNVIDGRKEADVNIAAERTGKQHESAKQRVVAQTQGVVLVIGAILDFFRVGEVAAGSRNGKCLFQARRQRERLRQRAVEGPRLRKDREYQERQQEKVSSHGTHSGTANGRNRTAGSSGAIVFRSTNRNDVL